MANLKQGWGRARQPDDGVDLRHLAVGQVLINDGAGGDPERVYHARNKRPNSGLRVSADDIGVACKALDAFDGAQLINKRAGE